MKDVIKKYLQPALIVLLVVCLILLFTKISENDSLNAQIAKLNERLEQQQITCRLTDEAKNLIVDAAYDPQYGARPLRRYVQHTVETMLSKQLLRGEVLPGQQVTIDAKDGQLVLQ